MIIFEKIRWKNFLSTGNAFTEIILTRNDNTLIVGDNGAGKSTLIDALTFSLFGKSFRNINKPQLINSINESDCLVECEFNIGNKKYLVRRGIKPNIFEIYQDDKLINQDAKSKDYQDVLEKSILKLNFKSFTQIIVLGSSSFVPFMQLKASDRRNIIEDLLDIQIFSVMNTLLKERISKLKNDILSVDHSYEMTEEKIKIQENLINTIKKENQTRIKDNLKLIDDNTKFIQNYSSKIESYKKHISELENRIVDKIKVDNKVKKLKNIKIGINDNVKKITRDIEFYENTSVCGNCEQPITEDHKTSQIEIKKKKLDDINTGLIKLDEEIHNYEERLNEIRNINNEIFEYEQMVNDENSNIRSCNNYIEKLNNDIDKIRKNKSSLDSEIKILDEFNESLIDYKKKKNELIKLKIDYDTISVLLKDTGIKTKIVKKYLPIINKLINKYLTSMDFFVNFTLDENFNETIKSRHRDIFSYSSFSEGEKMRIDLSLLFTWRKIAQLKNSTNTNLLILDEVFDSSLDGSGTDEFLRLIHEMDTGTNVFVISHKGDILYDKFHHIVKFEKYNNFSRIVR